MPDEVVRPGVAAVLPAAGRGLRMGGDRKQFRLLGDDPIFVHSVRVFDRHPRIDQIVLAVPPDAVDRATLLLSAASLQHRPVIVPGGPTRRASVQNGLDAVAPDVKVVLVHDAVRPFLSPSYIDEIIDAALADGAASLAVPVADTLRRGEQGRFGALVDRSETFRVQTPQGFLKSLLERAYGKARVGGEMTDDASLVMSAGYPVRIVIGSSFNFKITTDEDWALASILWPVWDETLRGKG